MNYEKFPHSGAIIKTSVTRSLGRNKTIIDFGEPAPTRLIELLQLHNFYRSTDDSDSRQEKDYRWSQRLIDRECCSPDSALCQADSHVKELIQFYNYNRQCPRFKGLNNGEYWDVAHWELRCYVITKGIHNARQGGCQGHRDIWGGIHTIPRDAVAVNNLIEGIEGIFAKKITGIINKARTRNESDMSFDPRNKMSPRVSDCIVSNSTFGFKDADIFNEMMKRGVTSNISEIKELELDLLRKELDVANTRISFLEGHVEVLKLEAGESSVKAAEPMVKTRGVIIHCQGEEDY